MSDDESHFHGPSSLTYQFSSINTRQDITQNWVGASSGRKEEVVMHDLPKIIPIRSIQYSKQRVYWTYTVEDQGWKKPMVFIARQHTEARYWYSNSVCPSVCPFVRDVPVSDENALTYRHSFFTIWQPSHSGRPKMRDPTMTDLTLTDQVAGLDIDRPDNDGPSSRGGHWRTW